MTNYKYLIIGGGMTAAAAVEGIREVDQKGSIGLISTEPDPPYNRPPLTKGLWKGDKLDSIWRKVAEYGVTTHLGRTAQHLDPQSRRVVDDQNTDYTYEKLLLATGAAPNVLPFGGEQVIYFRNLQDYQRLRAVTERNNHFAVIGGGFIGWEIAAALTMNGKEVVMVFPDKAIGSRMFPSELAEFLSDFYRGKGIDVMPESSVTGMEGSDGKSSLQITHAKGGGKQEVTVDGVVAGIGVKPNVELAKAAGIEVENGIRVDSALLTNKPDIYAAGDAACFHNPALDVWLRAEHEDNANTMGRCAGASMAGSAIAYDHQPFFYSDLFELGFEAVGEVDSRMETIADWKHPYKEGVIYYMREGRIRGVLLWNVWDQVDAARRLIASTEQVHQAELIGRLPE